MISYMKKTIQIINNSSSYRTSSCNFTENLPENQIISEKLKCLSQELNFEDASISLQNNIDIIDQKLMRPILMLMISFIQDEYSLRIAKINSFLIQCEIVECISLLLSLPVALSIYLYLFELNVLFCINYSNGDLRAISNHFLSTY